ncbi:MAG: hypothetical protein ACM35E_12150, partial [Deltaproteobacteria bacterium]
NAGNAMLSLGCCGARAYLDALDDRVSMWALPGIKIESYCAEILALARANQVLTSFHKRRRRRRSGRTSDCWAIARTVFSLK